MKSDQTNSRCRQVRDVAGTKSGGAFTLVEMLAVLGVLAMGTALIAPALAKTRPAAQSIQCLNNLRQLMNAMSMYTQEHTGLFPPNPDDGNSTPGHNWVSGQAGMGGGQEFNPDVLANPTYSRFATFLGSNVSVFACSADTRLGVYQGTDPLRFGKIIRAARSVSLNGAVGNVCANFASFCSGHSGIPNRPVVGSWLSGNHSCSANNWRTYGKASDIVNPSPSNLFIMMEEDPRSINDGFFSFSAGVSKWVDYPSALHNSAGVVAFADGHSELHQWVESTTRLTGPPATQPVASDDRDWLWLKARTTALR